MAGLLQFQQQYQKSPIIFTGGIAGSVAGQLPIVNITQAASFNTGVTSSSSDDGSAFVFDFNVMPGGTLADFQIASYPFANQTIAANSIISQPLSISLMMLSPTRPNDGGYDFKKAIFATLQSSVQQHARLGGTYTIATPSYFYTNCILLNLRDASTGDPGKPQSQWLWSFTQPLVTQDAAASAANTLMQKLQGGSQLTANADGTISTSGVTPSIGNPGSVITPSLIPSAQTLGQTSVAN